MTKKTLLSALPSLILLIIALFTGKSAMDSKELVDDLTAKLNAESGAPAAVVASDGKVEVVYRDRVVEKFLPPEGSIKFDTAKYQQAISALDSLLRLQAVTIGEGHPDSAEASAVSEPDPVVTPAAINASIDSLRSVIADPEGSGILTIKTWGLCLRPQIGAGYTGELSPYIGAKVFFYNRLGITIGATSHQAGIGLNYRLDRWIKPLRNTEGMILYGIPFKKEYGGLYAGLAVNL